MVAPGRGQIMAHVDYVESKPGFFHRIVLALTPLYSSQNAVLLAFASLFAALSWLTQLIVGKTPDLRFLDYFELMALLVPTFSFVLAVLWFLNMAVRVRPASPLRHALVDLRSVMTTDVLLHRLVPAFLYLYLVMTAYGGIKANIGSLNGYSWDAPLAELDRILFAGTDPWMAVHALFPGVFWAKLINVLYHLWFFIMFGLWFWVAGLPTRDRYRTVFLLSYGLVWAIGGILIATAFASVGPCFYERLLGDPHFSPLVDTLRSYDLMAVALQDDLWNIFATNGDAPGAGLSAFPSMHCASATLFALFGFTRSRGLGWALTAFAVCIYIGSIYLGWHYAVDGIAGVAIALCVWIGCGYLQRRIDRMPADRALPAKAPVPA